MSTKAVSPATNPLIQAQPKTQEPQKSTSTYNIGRIAQKCLCAIGTLFGMAILHSHHYQPAGIFFGMAGIAAYVLHQFDETFYDYNNPRELRRMRALAQFKQGRPDFVTLVQQHGLENLRKYEIVPLAQLQKGFVDKVKAVSLSKFLTLYPHITLENLRKYGVVNDENWKYISTLTSESAASASPAPDYSSTENYEDPVQLRNMRAIAQFKEGQPSFVELVHLHGLDNLCKYNIAPLSQMQEGLIAEIKKVSLAKFLDQNPDLSVAVLRKHGIITNENWSQIAAL